MVKARLAEQARIPATSISTYLDALETLFILGSLPPWTSNLTRREIGRPKSLVEDPALALRLAGVPAATLLTLGGYDHLGGFLEAFVVTELLKQQSWSDTSYRLFHFRDRNGLGVDIVVELDDGSVIGIEVESSGTFRSEHFAGLKTLAEKLGGRFRGGYVLGTAQQEVRPREAETLRDGILVEYPPFVDTTIKVDSALRDRLALLAAERGVTMRQLVADLAADVPTRAETAERHAVAVEYVRNHFRPEFDADDEAAGQELWATIGRLQEEAAAGAHPAA